MEKDGWVVGVGFAGVTDHPEVFVQGGTMAYCPKCGNRKVKRPHGKRYCRRCGPIRGLSINASPQFECPEPTVYWFGNDLGVPYLIVDVG